jgi:hypothetical protein
VRDAVMEDGQAARRYPTPPEPGERPPVVHPFRIPVDEDPVEQGSQVAAGRLAMSDCIDGLSSEIPLLDSECRAERLVGDHDTTVSVENEKRLAQPVGDRLSKDALAAEARGGSGGPPQGPTAIYVYVVVHVVSPRDEASNAAGRRKGRPAA